METHPFAQYVAALGRGKNKTRPLTGAEAEEAMAMILRGEVLPEQLGAFLMLLRVKEETPEEIAGFVRAARATFTLPGEPPAVDLDWSSYAGKRRQIPWYLLAALALAQSGLRVFMHGAEGHTPGRVYTTDALASLGLSSADSLEDAARRLGRENFAYLPLTKLCPRLHELINLRPILGLRSPVHTLSRLLNPLAADHVLQGIFHVGYMGIHQGAAAILGYRHMAVFRGEGGEIERRPNKPCEVWTVHDGAQGCEDWPALLPDPRQQMDETMDVGRLGALWRGQIDDAYGHAAVTGTLAVALKLLGRAPSIEDAQSAAETLWAARDRDRLQAVA